METLSTEPIDATLTEKEAPRERASTRKRMDVDWQLVKRRFQSGEPVMQIANELGIPAQTAYARIRRSKWKKPDPQTVQRVIVPAAAKTVAQETKETVQREVQLMAPALAAEARRKLNDWFERVLSTTEILHRQISDASSKRLEVEEIKSLSSSLETVDRIARRTFGLDSPTGSASPVSVFSVASPAIACPIIDVDTLPEATPATPAASKL